ncbi:hypothetical protein F4802DRAFT_593565 [Xylaria palmicola]|nr:hypothetical protein F4802DRAFT_593565 [Xylaria palmicola]
MTTEEPQKGDKVSWSWGGGAPGGTVAETKDEGEIAIQSKRGNTVKKNASPDNPAVRIERSGNDVVKRASELTVDKKAAQDKNSEEDESKKRKAESQAAPDTEADDAESDTSEVGDVENQHTINEQGKEVKKGGKDANKRQKAHEKEDVKGKLDESEAAENEEGEEKINEGIEEEQLNEEDEEEEAEYEVGENRGGEDEDVKSGHADTSQTPANGKRLEVHLNKDTGRPPSKSKAETKKDPAAREGGDVVSTRTRSRGKAS